MRPLQRLSGSWTTGTKLDSTFQAGARHLPLVMFAVDDTLTIRSWNLECEDTIGHGMNVVGQPLSTIIHRAIHLRQAGSRVQTACIGATPRPIEILFRREDGNRCHLLCQFFPVDPQDGSAGRCIVLGQET
jgi:PAS domain-containing protein